MHPDNDVERALIALSDALCTWERNTGVPSILILRERGGFEYRAMSGKPGIPSDVSDEQLIETLND